MGCETHPASVGEPCASIPIRVSSSINTLPQTAETVIEADTKKDLNAYGEVEGQAGCCSPPALGSSLPIVEESCCSPAEKNAVHGGFAELLRRFDVNEFAASVQVYAVKPL